MYSNDNSPHSSPDSTNRYTDGYGPDWQTPKKFSYHEGLEGGYKNLIRKDFMKEGKFPENPTVWQYWEEGDNPPQNISSTASAVYQNNAKKTV